jgi:hypothetical protein
MRHHWLLLVVAGMLFSCAGTRPPGPSQARQGWDGAFAGRKIGLYLAMGRSTYTVAQFETLAQADDVLHELDSGVRWSSIDSGNRLLANLGGWDLDSLGDRILSDSAVWAGTRQAASPSLGFSDPSLAASTRSALERVGKAFGIDLLIVLRPGGNRNAKDSAADFRSPAWFGVFDSAGTQLYSLDVPTTGTRSAARSAETDWARQVWKSFEKGIRQVRNLPPTAKP